jgi:maltodextrin utilization protein YvdJ
MMGRKIFKAGLSLSDQSFALLNGKFISFLGYFLILNLVMFIPLTFSIYQLDSSVQTLFGINVTPVLPDDLGLLLPADCEIVNQRLLCENDVETVITIPLERPITVVINAQSDEYDEAFDHLVLKETTASLRLNNARLELDYRGFGYVPFNELQTLEKEAVYTLFFDGFYASVRPFFALPMILILVGGYIALNVILLFGLSGFAMLFRLTISDLPAYKEMVKLFIIGSTIPAVINLIIGFFGLSAFSSLVYNFLTPLMVFILYRRHVNKVAIDNRLHSTS